MSCCLVNQRYSKHSSGYTGKIQQNIRFMTQKHSTRKRSTIQLCPTTTANYLFFHLGFITKSAVKQ